MSPRSWLPLALGVLCLGEQTRLELRPTDELELAIRAERTFELELVETELEVEVDGESVGDREPPGLTFTMTEVEVIDFIDRFEVADGAVQRLDRTFRELGTNYMEEVTDPLGEAFSQENAGESALEGWTVRFDFDKEGGDEGRSFLGDDGEAPERLLAGLEPEAHLADFLPAGSVDSGESWEVPVTAFVRMMNLSGNLGLVQEGDTESADDTDYSRQFDENLTGSILATLVEQGDGVARIELKAKLGTRIVTEEELTEGEVSGSLSEKHEFSFTLEGQLLWLVEPGLPRALTLEGPLSLVMTTDQQQSVPGHELRMLERQHLEGTLGFEVTAR